MRLAVAGRKPDDERMIRALVFDLDDTLVQTERLKALSYAKAAHELRPDLSEDDVIEAFKDVVGGARNEVAQALMQRFALAAPAQARLAEMGLDHPWQVFLRIRQRFYDDILADEADVGTLFRTRVFVMTICLILANHPKPRMTKTLDLPILTSSLCEYFGSPSKETCPKIVEN